MAITVTIYIKIHACDRVTTFRKNIAIGESFLYKGTDERFINILHGRFMKEKITIREIISDSLPKGFVLKGGVGIINKVYLPWFVLEDKAITFNYEIQNENSFDGSYSAAMRYVKKALKTAKCVLQ